MRKLLLFAAVGMLLIGCTTTKHVPVVETKTDTVYQVRQQRDSVWLHDSVFVNQWRDGDTVFQVRDRWHTQYVEKLRVDTFREVIFDSIPQPYPVTEYVAKPLSWWQKTRMHAGEAAMLMLLASGAYLVLMRKKA